MGTEESLARPSQRMLISGVNRSGRAMLTAQQAQTVSAHLPTLR